MNELCMPLIIDGKKNPEILLGVPGQNVIIGRDYHHYYYLALNRALYLQSVDALETYIVQSYANKQE